MYKGYKIVVNTAAGRRRYMRFLVPYVLECDIVDRYDIWIHTHNCADIEFFKKLAEKYPKVNLVWQPDGIVGGNSTINAFYRDCIDEDTIYFKLDDDVIWMEKDAIQKMVEYRIEHSEYFIVSPLVINNPLCTYLLQTSGKLQLRQYQMANPLGEILWKSGNFAYELHNWFFNNGGIENYEDIHCGNKIIGVNRLSINAILWFGKDLKEVNGVIPGDDEEFLSCLYPSSKGLTNGVNGDCLIVHYAFFTQRALLDASDLLQKYNEFYQVNRNETSKIVDEILIKIESRADELNATPSPYKRPQSSTPKKRSVNEKILSWGRKIAKRLMKEEAYSPYILNSRNS